MTTMQYRCILSSLCRNPTKGEWIDEGTGHHADLKSTDTQGSSIEWREKPMEENNYLGSFEPNSLRAECMDRAGEWPDTPPRYAFSGLGIVVGQKPQREAFGTTPAERSRFPLYDGLLAYFPDALAWVSRCSYEGNQQHNPGQPMHWAMDKSTDHENKIMRHMMEGFTDDDDGVPHSVKVAWRALARAQEDLMRRKGAPMPPNARRSGNPISQSDEE